MPAVFDSTRVYRYRLDRHIGPSQKTCMFVLLNPSTADESSDDPTIRRCKAFARREGCGNLIVCNLYAYRSTDPRILSLIPDPIGRENRQYIIDAMKDADIIVAAWGSNHLGGEWVEEVKRLLGFKCRALKINLRGDPGHPLYLPSDSPLLPYGPAVTA